MQISSITKAIINVLTLVVAVGGPLASLAGHLSPPVGATIGIVVAGVGAVLHWLVPNTTTDPHVAATQSVRLRAQPKPPEVGQPHGPLT